jgi:hypothetical protein
VWRRFTVDAPERLDSQIKERRHVGFLRDITTNNNCATAAALDLAPKLLSWFALRVVVDCHRGAVYGESPRNSLSDAGVRANHDRSGARKTSFFAHMQTSSPRPHINPQAALSIPRLWCFWG